MTSAVFVKDNDVVALYESGESMTRTAAAAGRSVQWVRTRLKRAGIAVRSAQAYGGRPPVHLDVVEAARLYERGMSLREVGARLGCSAPVVRRRLDRAGVRIRSSTKQLGDPPEGMLWCTCCRQAKAPTDFNACNPTRRGRAYHCKECMRRQHLDRKYGLSADDYDAMRSAQDDRCVICFRSLSELEKRGFSAVHVDHCHETGAVRAVLCGHCNTALGAFEDDPARLRRAARYIEAHRDGQTRMDV